MLAAAGRDDVDPADGARRRSRDGRLAPDDRGPGRRPRRAAAGGARDGTWCGAAPSACSSELDALAVGRRRLAARRRPRPQGGPGAGRGRRRAARQAGRRGARGRAAARPCTPTSPSASTGRWTRLAGRGHDRARGHAVERTAASSSTGSPDLDAGSDASAAAMGRCRPADDDRRPRPQGAAARPPRRRPAARPRSSSSPRGRATPTCPRPMPTELGRWFREAADSGSLERYLETFDAHRRGDADRASS